MAGNGGAGLFAAFWERLFISDKSVQRASGQDLPDWEVLHAHIALKLQRCVNSFGRAVLEQYVVWFPVPPGERADLHAFQNCVAAFSFRSIIRQVATSRTCNINGMLPRPMKPTVDARLAEKLREYMISHHAGNRDIEMMERPLEALFFLGKGESADKLIRDEGRKGKTAGSILRKTVFGDRASQVDESILTTYDEARKQISQHLHAQVFEFDEFSPKDWLSRSILMALSGGSPIFVRKPYGKESDQMNWR